MWISQKKQFLLDILFPKFCIFCKKEGEYVCEDCLSLIEISEYQFCHLCGKRIPPDSFCAKCRGKTSLNKLFAATDYKTFVKKIIISCKYKPYIKELSEVLAFLIINHFSLINNHSILKDCIIIAVPLAKKQEKARGFNQSQEIAKHISKFFNLLIYSNVLIRTKSKQSQVGLSSNQRKENVKNVFICKEADLIKNKKILLIDDIYTTGSTMNECAKILKKAGASQVWGAVVARE